MGPDPGNLRKAAQSLLAVAAKRPDVMRDVFG